MEPTIPYLGCVTKLPEFHTKSRVFPPTVCRCTGAVMTRKLALMTTLIALAATPAFAQKQRLAVVDANGNLDALIRQHAAANNLPEDLVRRVIKRESGGNARVVRAGEYGPNESQVQTEPLM